MSERTAGRFADIDQAARAVAREFLQSVVVVDDRAALGSEDVPLAAREPTEEEASPSRSRRQLPRLRAPARGVNVPIPEQALDAKVLVDGFAELGLVCAVIRPSPGDATIMRTVRAARRADIVVLDWELNNDGGATTKQIIRRLVQDEAEAEPQGRLRLIAVYSGALTLKQIASAIRISLAEDKDAVSFKKDGEFSITAGSVRIVVYAKPTTRLGHAGDALRARVIAGADLPETLVGEFASMTKGLVPHVALASLAALRKNMHRVLGRLRADLDAGYLWHRATQQRPVDAQEHLVELVAGELRSVLDDERVGEWADLDAIKQWLEADGRTDFSGAFGEKSIRTKDQVVALLTKGTAGKASVNQDVRDNFSQMSVEKGAHRVDAISAFAATPKAAKRSNEDLAALMSLSTRYEHPLPQLQLGTVLAHGRGKTRKYFVCVQPRCDSVRLAGYTAFPMLPLLPVEGTKKFDVLIPSDSKDYQRFRLSKKPANIKMPEFAINPAAGDAVVADRYGSGFSFTSRTGIRYAWVADLKPEHAQRIAQQLANEFSRVGLTESEWQRLWASKG